MLKSLWSFVCTAVAVTNALPRLFAALAEDKSATLPYKREVADQRRKYGDVMLRKADDQLEKQREYEAEQNARLEAARQKRFEEKRKLEEAEVRVPSCGAPNERVTEPSITAPTNGRTSR
jgi:hypothetical protein